MSKYLLLVLIFTTSLSGEILDDLSDSQMDEDSLESSDSFDSSQELESAMETDSYRSSAPQQSIIHADESDGPDSGNWLEKLKWWKEAKWLYTIDITAVMGQLEEVSKGYEAREKEIMAALEEYSSSLPFKRQTAEAVIDDLLSTLLKRQEDLAQQQTRAQGRVVSPESAEIEENQKLLNQLRENIKDFNTMSQRLNQAFDEVLAHQVQDAHELDEMARVAYESIERTLDDKVAQGKFEEVQNSFENIKALIEYLEGPLMHFIDQAWDKVQQLMPTIKSSVEELEKRGIIVGQPGQTGDLGLTAKKRAELAAQRAAEKKAAEEHAARPWWKKIIFNISSFFSSIGSALLKPFLWIGSLFSGPAPQQNAVKPLLPKKAQP